MTIEHDALRFAAGDDDAIIEGWAVPFDGSFGNGVDSYGTRFSARTEFRLDWYSERPLLYHHGLDKDVGLDPVGVVRSMEIRDKGVWMKAQLDKQSEYFEAIRQMVKDGKMFLSSGSVEHLVQINQRTGHVDVWPIVEQTMTTTPSNLLADIPVASFRSALPDTLPDGITEDDTIIHTAVRDADAEPPAVRADPMDDEVGSDERSFEDICSDLDGLLNPVYSPAYTRRIDTFPTHVLVQRYEYDSGSDEDSTYWDIPYTIGPDLEPVLGTPVQVERTESYTPMVRAAEMPLSLDAQLMIRHAATFADSTKDYGERRFREGRVMSGANMQTLSDTIDGMQKHVDTLRDLHKKASAKQDEAARAALFANPEWVRVRIKLLEFSTV